MVQRKVPNKLRIKADHVKSDTHLVNLRPSSPQTHDLKKKMKKSRPIKRSDSDHLKSSPPLRKTKTQPDKPPPQPPSPPLHLQASNGGGCSAAATPRKQSPNYMKSTSSFEARKERSPPLSSRVSPITNKNPSPKISDKSKTHSSGARTSSLKLVRTLTKSPSFKPSRPAKKCSPVVFCEDLDARATCSSTLKDSKFPNYLELSPGGTELEGPSVMKVCPYNYCSLNGHHHAPSPLLRCFLSARRRALKTQKSFKLGCLSPRQSKPIVKKNKEPKDRLVIMAEEAPITPLVEEENRDFFIEIYSKDGEGTGGHDSERSDIDWEAGYDSRACLDEGETLKSWEIDDGDVGEEQILKPSIEGLYDEESVSSGAWFEDEEDGDSESDESYQQTKINHQSHDQVFPNSDVFEVSVSPTTAEEDGKNDMDETWGIVSTVDKITGITREPNATRGFKNAVFKAKDELQGLNLPTGSHDIKYNVDYQQEETHQGKESESAGHAQDGTEKNHTTIYNIIQVNISVFVTGEKTEHSETDQGDLVQVTETADADKMEIEEVADAKMVVQDEASELAEEQDMTNEGDDDNKLTAVDEASEVNQMVADEELPLDTQEIVSNEQLNANNILSQGSPVKECNENEAYIRSNSMGSEDDKHSEDSGLWVTEQDEHAVDEMDTCEIKSDTEMKSPILRKERTDDEELPDPSVNLRGSTRGKKPDHELEDSREFNPRGPNFLPLVPEPDAETVDLRHQMIDERKNAEEWMVDYALQQAVTTLAPARKRKVALLVEAFEKVMPIPKYETQIRHTSKAFTHTRPMQACS